MKPLPIRLTPGQMLGGHVAAGCIVRTTAEVLLALLLDWQFARFVRVNVILHAL